MMTKDHFIHKHGYGFLFRDPEYMKRLIRDFVDKDFYNQLDFRDCEPLLEKSYLTDEYKEFAEDLVFKIKLRGRAAYIYILVEFQSTPDRFISLRILNYLTLFYLDYIKEYKQTNKCFPEKLPPVLPLLLYNGEDPWNVPDNVKDLIEDNEFLKPFYPDFRYFKIIERDIPIEELKKIGTVVSSVFMVERFGKEELSVISESLKDVLEKEDIHVLRLFVVWLKHLLLNKRLDERALYEAMNIRNKMETTSMLVNTIQTWGQEIKETGIEEASMTIAEKMLKKDLNWNIIVETTGVTQERYEQWKMTKKAIINAA